MPDENALRIALIGAGRMGADHAVRLGRNIKDVRTTVVSDPDVATANRTAASLPEARVETDPSAAIAATDVDAVLLASPGPTHEKLLLDCLDRDLPVLCEKPLTPDAESSRRVVDAELALGRQRVQVGFMRRFDPEFEQLKELLGGGDLGRPLVLHCAHRNPASPPGFTEDMLISDSVVHEFDTVRWLLGDEIAAITVRRPRSTAHAPDGMADPQLVSIETVGGSIAEVEIFVNCTFGYQVRCEAVCEGGTALVGADSGPVRHTARGWGGSVPADFRTRFARAYDTELQRWVDAARSGAFDGPSAWDGYAAAAACEAGLRAQSSGERAAMDLGEVPHLYR